MSRKHPRRALWRVGLVVAVVAIAAVATTSFASAGSKAQSKQAPNKIVARAVGNGNNLRFVLSSNSINAGGSLVIKNNTSEPHTFSLVKKNLVPKTKSQIKKCFHKGHICKAIAKWHKIHGQKVGVKYVDVGGPGWNREGNLKRKGDSDFLDVGKKPPLRAVTAAPGKTLHFICAIHPWMHGTIHVR